MIQISRNSARAYTTFIQSLYYKVYITSKIANRQRLEVLREESRRLPAFEHADSDRNRKFSRETLKVQKRNKSKMSVSTNAKSKNANSLYSSANGKLGNRAFHWNSSKRSFFWKPLD